MLTVKDLEAAGYHKFKANGTLKSADFGMQKCFEDNQGERYHITVYVYDFSQFSEQNERFKTNPWSFEPNVQFRGNDQPTLDVVYHADDATTVTNVEEFFARMWEFLGRPYC
jgi:hypothetical protein